MEPVAPPPVDQRPMIWHSRWECLRRSWRSWVPFVPPVIYLVGLILHVRLNSVVGSLLNVACYAFYGVLLAPLLLNTMKAKPSVFRLRMMRRIMAGAILSIVAIVCLAITTAVSGQSNSAAQVTLVVIVFVGFGIIFLAMCIGLFDASKNAIERYRSEYPGSSDA
jgi:hypothetical protein